MLLLLPCRTVRKKRKRKEGISREKRRRKIVTDRKKRSDV